jgi:RHS repeat-associated protein
MGMSAVGNSTFKVLVDGEEVYNSDEMTPGMTQTILLDVSGMDLLELITEINGNYMYDHTDWADARLIKYAKKEVGAYYLRARYYQPTTGRFMSEDSIRSGLNWYTYCGGNPVRFIDPTGLAKYQLGGMQLAPQFEHDHGFEYDLNAKATFGDRWDYATWYTKGRAAQEFGWWLQGAAAQYLHYMEGSGKDRTINYSQAYKDDSVIKSYIDKEISLMKNFAQSSYKNGAGNSFEIIGGLLRIPNGDKENWQKVIGAHYVYGYGNVTVDSKTNMAIMLVTFYMEDMYNFNPGESDIATGTPDSVNGRFAILGWAKEFKTLGSMTVTITWNVNDSKANPKIKIGGQR